MPQYTNNNGTTTPAINEVSRITTALTQFEGFAATRIGGRAENQDTVAFNDTPLGLLVMVCDGMGGGPGGKTASTIAAAEIGNYISTLKTHKDPEIALREAIGLAHQAIQTYASTHQGFRGMGSTVAALLISDDCAYAAHVGDSRIYQLRGHNIVYRSTDHSKVMELVKAHVIDEEQARTSGESNIITQALGHGGEKDPEIVRLPYLKGDRFCLCSDGIWGVFPQKEIITMFAASKSPAGSVDSTMIQVDNYGQANGNHHDNLSLAIVDTTQNSKLKTPMTKTVKITLIVMAALLLASIVANVVLIAGRSSSPAKSSPGVMDADSLLRIKDKKIDSLMLEVKAAKAEKDDARAAAIDAGARADQAEAERYAEANNAAAAGTLAQRIDKAIASVENLKKEKNAEKCKATAEKLVKEIRDMAKTANGETKAQLETAAAELDKDVAKNVGARKHADQLGYVRNILAKAKQSAK